MARSIRLPAYRSQILRMWVEQTAHHTSVWRFSLEDIESGTRSGFSDLDALICYLLELMEGGTAAPEETDPSCPFE